MATGKSTEKTPRTRKPGGVHVAYSADRTTLFVESSEIRVLRHAVRQGLRVAFWPYGMTLDAAIEQHEKDNPQAALTD